MLLLVEILGEVLVGEQALQDSDHVAEVQRVDDACDGNLVFFDGDGYDWEEDILHDGRSTAVHLGDELPQPIIDDKVILFFPDVISEDILVGEELSIVDAPHLPHTLATVILVLEVGSILLRPLFLNQKHVQRFILA